MACSDIKTGDKGQRFLVQCLGYPEDGWNDMAYTDDPETAQRLARSFAKAPSAQETRVKDRGVTEPKVEITFPKAPYPADGVSYFPGERTMVLEAFVRRDTHTEVVWVLTGEASLERDRAAVELQARQKLNKRKGYFTHPEIARNTRMITVEVG